MPKDKIINLTKNTDESKKDPKNRTCKRKLIKTKPVTNR